MGCVNLKINLQKHALFHRQTNTIKCSILITQFMITIQILDIKFLYLHLHPEFEYLLMPQQQRKWCLLLHQCDPCHLPLDILVTSHPKTLDDMEQHALSTGPY